MLLTEPVSPELLCDGRLTKGADVYAFGVLLWELITGPSLSFESSLKCVHMYHMGWRGYH